MPITKVPIVHKFGIISHSQRLELQERLLKQSYLQSLQEDQRFKQYKNPLEVTDEFINQFNAARHLDDKERLEDQAYRMLERIKRRSGLRGGGQGSHVDLPLAWTELSQLAQCKGKIQEDCLDVMVSSLDQSPLSETQVPALFYLGEMCLYWLRTDIVSQPYLRTGEIKLLKMGQLVFTRLFYHHMAGELSDKQQYKRRLFTYLDGFEDCQEAYNPYPNALLSIRYINEVGKIVIADAMVTKPSPPTNTEEIAATTTTEQSETSTKVSQHESDIFREVATNVDKLSTIVSGTTRVTSSNTGISRKTGASGALSSSVHDLSPTLWHSLDVWRCVAQSSGGIEDALSGLSRCGAGLVNESWVDGMCALGILAEAAKLNTNAMRGLQNLARGFISRKTTRHHDEPTGNQTTPRLNTESSEMESGTTEILDTIPDSTNQTLSDIYERTEVDSSDISNRRRDDTDTSSSRRGDESDAIDAQLESVSQSKIDGAGIAGRTGAQSRCSISGTTKNHPKVEVAGLHGWHWEVAITYADLLTDIVLHGATANIQKRALVGTNVEYNNVEKRSSHAIPMKSAGLLDLVYFISENETKDWGPNDWSWKVRYTAIQGLVKICRCLTGDKSREGIHTVAWNTVLRAHVTEKDSRVLEGLKVGQVDANIEKLINEHLTVAPSSISVKIATRLSQSYLPPLPPIIKTPTPRSDKKSTPPRRPEQQTASRSPRKQQQSTSRRPQQQQQRTTLKDELKLATGDESEKIPDYNTRMSFDLRRIVEDQWRKELQIDLERDEKLQQTELADEQTQHERDRRQTQLNKQHKLQRGLKTSE
ncbi:transmembrane protein 232-like [Tubulanus polymorphus]|uniref:transmembrane protein 232-like n=1 Tax=Tubulanus polymorphus TaxID=672921 RepID=UPI003DA35CB1